MDRNKIDAIFGSEATDKNLRYMGKHWTLKDVEQYLDDIQDFGENDAQEIYDWLRNFSSN